MVMDNPINLIKPPRILASSRITMIIIRPMNNTKLLIKTYFFISFGFLPSSPSASSLFEILLAINLIHDINPHEDPLSS